MKKDSLQMALSDDDEPHPSGSPSPIVHMGKVTEPEEVDIDEEKAEDEEHSDSDFGGGSEDLDGVASVRREEIEECETASVRNSEDFGGSGPEQLSVNDRPGVSLILA
jgi:hypothetical protein